MPARHPVPAAKAAMATGSWDLQRVRAWWRGDIAGAVDHEAVMARIRAESGCSPRYLFMILMSAGIAVLGLLISSPAVIIGAMLISPLINPILGFGFSLAVFEFSETKRSLIALVMGSVCAVAFTALIVLASPLKDVTSEILSRTRPNLFDLLIALFAALAGAYAIIRGGGGTIVGVAIATALMPPLAVVGFGLATWNPPVLVGALALFTTNFVTIALAATVVARFFGFGHALSSHQSWLQTAILVLVFVGLSGPLGVSLNRIAREAVIQNEVRVYLKHAFGAAARLSQVDVDFQSDPLAVHAVVITPRSDTKGAFALKAGLQTLLDRPVALQVDQLLSAGAGEIGAQRAELRRAADAELSPRPSASDVATAVSIAAGVAPGAVVVDADDKRAMATAASLPGADLASYEALERRAAASSGWDVVIIPPFACMPLIRFADGSDALDPASKAAVLTSAWAAKRWNMSTLGVPGLPAGPGSETRPRLAQRRALAIAAILSQSRLHAAPLPPAGLAFRLVPAGPPSAGFPILAAAAPS